MAWASGSTGSAVRVLPDDLLLMIFDHLNGVELHSAMGVCPEWHALVLKSTYLWRAAVELEFNSSVIRALSELPNKQPDWRKVYVRAFIQARIECLNSCRMAYANLKVRLGDLEELLMQAQCVRQQLSSSAADGMSLPLFGFVDEMEQDVLMRQYEAEDDLLSTQVQLEVLQEEVELLQARQPRWLLDGY